ncbi:MAG TPA: beta-propeller fold lactonase family protein [Candidatus Baltobacteraceae bacterium]|jgi:YVTN family beta-propeller protein|nr:beta-propeller fold lactonase family protein [Candidatus Baltobacteraceae bacterium]
MLRRVFPWLAAVAALCGVSFAAVPSTVVLPSGWRLSPPEGLDAKTGTMPQGIALSPDGTMLAVVESGVAPATLRIFDAGTLTQRSAIALDDAFGTPVWRDASHILVAGAATHAVLDVDARTSQVRRVSTGATSLPVCVALAPGGRTLAICDDANGGVILASLPDLSGRTAIRTGAHPAAAAFSSDGKTLYAAARAPSSVAVIDTARKAIAATIPVGLHPSALAFSEDGARLFVAESDDDSIGIVDTSTRKRTGGISVELRAPRATGFGASPNALAVSGDRVFVSLGAENAVGVIRNGELAERIPAGWYPTGVAVARDGRLFVSNGRGEGAHANPQFDPRTGHNGYVGLITVGSIRSLAPASYADAGAQTARTIDDASPDWQAPDARRSALRPNGPIRHVIYIIKENRSYDQVLGDISGANGDPRLVWFGTRVTPNQHALARRFGIFDNAYVDAQVSANGHNWTDAAFANDYVERFWPPNYGGRRTLYDFQEGDSPDVPHNGYLWDAAKRAGITYRDYGEDLDSPPHALLRIPLNTMPGLTGHFDPHFVGWDLSYMDDDRYAEWLREFRQFVAGSNLPQLEIVYFPNDHTAGSAPGMRTPTAYVAMNDWAVGRLVDTVSHSKYWRSTAIFILEDDAQDGPDHVSDQRSTFYVASPYAKGGVRHLHYSTSSFVRSMEILLGLQPLSIYDATARPLYDAFSATPANAAPFTALRPQTSMTAVNQRTAYGADRSARMDFSRPDAANERALNDILAHNSNNR